MRPCLYAKKRPIQLPTWLSVSCYSLSIVHYPTVEHPCCLATTILSHYLSVRFSSVQLLSRVQLFATPWTAAHQASLFITNSQGWLKLMSIESVMPSNHLILCRPLLLLPSIFPSIGVFSKEVSSSYQVGKVMKFQLKHQSFQWTPRTNLLQNGLVGFPCSPRDSQESSPTPQFKRINSSVLSFLHSPTLTSIHDHWKNHSFD